MDWQAIGVGVTAGIALIAGNAWVMKLVIDNAVLKAVKVIAEEYVTKEDFNRHVEMCTKR